MSDKNKHRGPKKDDGSQLEQQHSQTKKNIICYCCGGDHIVPDCPERKTRARKDWFANTKLLAMMQGEDDESSSSDEEEEEERRSGSRRRSRSRSRGRGRRGRQADQDWCGYQCMACDSGEEGFVANDVLLKQSGKQHDHLHRKLVYLNLQL